MGVGEQAGGGQLSEQERLLLEGKKRLERFRAKREKNAEKAKAASAPVLEGEAVPFDTPLSADARKGLPNPAIIVKSVSSGDIFGGDSASADIETAVDPTVDKAKSPLISPAPANQHATPPVEVGAHLHPAGQDEVKYGGDIQQDLAGGKKKSSRQNRLQQQLEQLRAKRCAVPANHRQGRDCPTGKNSMEENFAHEVVVKEYGVESVAMGMMEAPERGKASDTDITQWLAARESRMKDVMCVAMEMQHALSSIAFTKGTRAWESAAQDMVRANHSLMQRLEGAGFGISLDDSQSLQGHVASNCGWSPADEAVQRLREVSRRRQDADDRGAVYDHAVESTPTKAGDAHLAPNSNSGFGLLAMTFLDTPTRGALSSSGRVGTSHEPVPSRDAMWASPWDSSRDAVAASACPSDSTLAAREGLQRHGVQVAEPGGVYEAAAGARVGGGHDQMSASELRGDSKHRGRGQHGDGGDVVPELMWENSSLLRRVEVQASALIEMSVEKERWLTERSAMLKAQKDAEMRALRALEEKAQLQESLQAVIVELMAENAGAAVPGVLAVSRHVAKQTRERDPLAVEVPQYVVVAADSGGLPPLPSPYELSQGSRNGDDTPQSKEGGDAQLTPREQVMVGKAVADNGDDTLAGCHQGRHGRGFPGHVEREQVHQEQGQQGHHRGRVHEQQEGELDAGTGSNNAFAGEGGHAGGGDGTALASAADTPPARESCPSSPEVTSGSPQLPEKDSRTGDKVQSNDSATGCDAAPLVISSASTIAHRLDAPSAGALATVPAGRRVAPPPRPFPPELLAHPGDKEIQITLRHLGTPPAKTPPTAVASLLETIWGMVSLRGVRSLLVRKRHDDDDDDPWS